jgi:hypothetical protein
MSTPFHPKPPPGKPMQGEPNQPSYRRVFYERDAIANEPWNPATRLAQVRPARQRPTPSF